MQAAGVNFDLQAVAYHDNESGQWIAHCLEMDVVAAGETAESALSELMALCDVQILACLDDDDIAGIFRSAPPEVWALFAKASMVASPSQVPTAVEHVKTRLAA